MKLKAGVVGVRQMGKGHAKILAGLEQYELVAVADRDPAVLDAFEIPCARFQDFGALLAESQPNVVVVATPNDSHATLTRMAVAAGVRGVVCEKPMAVHLADARAMVADCQARGVALMVNHQRRLLPEVRAMRAAIAEGTIGKLQLVRTCNAGDILSDGTHAIDSLRFLVGDVPAEWVYGQVFRKDYGETSTGSGFDADSGRRFGHPVEDAGMAVIGFQGGIRAEMFFGELFPNGRWYQDYEAIGDTGRLWRPSDGQQPPLRRSSDAGWVEVPSGTEPSCAVTEGLRLFAETVRTGAPHPLDGATHGLAAMELVTAIYESARTHQRIELPCQAERFPLEQMLAEGAFQKVRP